MDIKGFPQDSGIDGRYYFDSGAWLKVDGSRRIRISYGRYGAPSAWMAAIPVQGGWSGVYSCIRETYKTNLFECHNWHWNEKPDVKAEYRCPLQ